MSYITDAVVICEFEEAVMPIVNAHLRAKDERRQEFGRLNAEDAAGGTKVFCPEIWAAAFNHIDPYMLKETLARAPWQEPHLVTIHIEQEGYRNFVGSAQQLRMWLEEAEASALSSDRALPDSLEERLRSMVGRRFELPEDISMETSKAGELLFTKYEFETFDPVQLEVLSWDTKARLFTVRAWVASGAEGTAPATPEFVLKLAEDEEDGAE